VLVAIYQGRNLHINYNYMIFDNFELLNLIGISEGGELKRGSIMRVH
jgi:hypothetical protein